MYILWSTCWTPISVPALSSMHCQTNCNMKTKCNLSSQCIYWVMMCMASLQNASRWLDYLQVSFQRVIFIRIKYLLLLQHLESVLCQRSWDYILNETHFQKTTHVFYGPQITVTIQNMFIVSSALILLSSKWPWSDKATRKYIYLSYIFCRPRRHLSPCSPGVRCNYFAIVQKMISNERYPWTKLPCAVKLKSVWVYWCTLSFLRI